MLLLLPTTPRTEAPGRRACRITITIVDELIQTHVREMVFQLQVTQLCPDFSLRKRAPWKSNTRRHLGGRSV